MQHDPRHPSTPNPSVSHPPEVDSRLPGPFDDEIPSQDPGSSSSRIVALWAAIILATTAIVWQHLPENTQYKALGLAPPPPAEVTMVVSRIENTSIMGKILVRSKDLLTSNAGFEASIDQLQTDLDKNALTPETQITAAIVMGEYTGSQTALDRLNQIESDHADPPLDNEILQDLKDLKAIYIAGGQALDGPSASRLRTRYDYFADVALTHDLDESSDEYLQLRSGGLAILLGFFFFGAVILLAAITGLVLLILGLIRYAGRKELPRFEPPAPGGSVMLETFALFVGVFLIFSIFGTMLAAQESPWTMFMLPLQFVLMALVLWPLLRGMGFTEWRQAVGLTAPRGVLREIGFGVLAYLATIPIYIAGIITSLLAIVITHLIRIALYGPQDDTPITQDINNPMIDLLAEGNWFIIAVLLVMVTVWAPITEELIFRGALYRHLRARMHWVFAVLLSAFLFAGVHNYPMIMTIQVFILGVMFALMRETRGSIIASMTAHFIHNASVFAMMILVLRPVLV